MWIRVRLTEPWTSPAHSAPGSIIIHGKTYYGLGQFARETAKRGLRQVLGKDKPILVHFQPSHLLHKEGSKKILLNQEEGYGLDGIFDLRGKTGILELAALLEQMDMILGVDSFCRTTFQSAPKTYNRTSVHEKSHLLRMA